MNRIDQVFKEKSGILNVYYTAGFPSLQDTLRIAKDLQDAGADILEIGIPFSDPLADGSTIQESSQIALENGMTLSLLFEQLIQLRNFVDIPVLLMGYMNPVLQYGVSRFVESCSQVGIDGVIIPDFPMQEYVDEYQSFFIAKNIYLIFLISPNTSEERIQIIDRRSRGFIYMVSSSSITGANSEILKDQREYFNRIKEMRLSNPRLIGFGIADKSSFDHACQYAHGAIIGSAFISRLKADSSTKNIQNFVKVLKGVGT